MRVRLWIGILLYCCAGLKVFAQVTAKLEAVDSVIQVGRPFRVDLEIEHPSDMVVIFPDTGMGIRPYEVDTFIGMPTLTTGEMSRDFRKYYLLSWEMDSIQYKRLPYWIVRNGDTVLQSTNEVKLYFDPYIKQPSDSMKLRMDGKILDTPVPPDRRWVYFLIVAVILIVGVGVGAGYRPLMRAIRRWREDRKWKLVLQSLEKLEGNYEQQEEFITELSRIWKNYLDADRRLKLGALTSSELEMAMRRSQRFRSEIIEDLIRVNRISDQILYAKLPAMREDLRNSFMRVRDILTEAYEIRRKEVGK